MIQDPKLRAFVDSFIVKPLPVITVKEAMKQYNHETWRTCKDCGDEFDWKKNNDCPKCGSKNFKNTKNEKL